MIFYPNCKINTGLDVLFKREDGFHQVATVMYPVGGLTDILEIVPSPSPGVIFTSSGLLIDCDEQSNLCVKAYHKIKELYGIGGVKIHLHKIIPFGAGLGGGSADAAYTIKGLNLVFDLEMTEEKMEQVAADLGSDTSFFIRNKPSLASGRGEVLEYIDVDLAGYNLLLIKPSFGISTYEAYSGINPSAPGIPLRERIRLPLEQWHGKIKNSFEEHVFNNHPVLSDIKSCLYDMGALYASMSGSGSAMYGIFPKTQTLTNQIVEELQLKFPDSFIYHEVMV